MKKILKISVITALIIASISFGAVSKEIQPNRQSHLYYSHTIATASYIEDIFYNVGDFDNLDFKTIAVNTGSITTASIAHIEYRNNDLNPTTKSELLTAGTAITKIEGNAIKYRINNPSASAPRVCTINVRIING